MPTIYTDPTGEVIVVDPSRDDPTPPRPLRVAALACVATDPPIEGRGSPHDGSASLRHGDFATGLGARVQPKEEEESASVGAAQVEVRGVLVIERDGLAVDGPAVERNAHQGSTARDTADQKKPGGRCQFGGALDRESERRGSVIRASSDRSPVTLRLPRSDFPTRASMTGRHSMFCSVPR
jgi:hypothetical protein